MIENGFAVSTFNNLTIDKDFKKCIGCAILQRSKERQGVPIGDECKACFDEYCWDGSTYTYEDDSYPDAFTDTGVYNSSVNQANPQEVQDVKTSTDSTATESTSAMSTGTVSSISSTHKNDAGVVQNVSPWVHLLTTILGYCAFL